MKVPRRSLLRSLPVAAFLGLGLRTISVLAQEEEEPSAGETEQVPQSAAATTSDQQATASLTGSYSEVPDFGNISPITKLTGEKVTKPAGQGATDIRGFDWFSDFKAEASFRFLTPTNSERPYAGISFGIRPPAWTIQGLFIVRPGGPSGGEFAGQGDIHLLYQVKTGDTWSGFNRLIADQFGRMGIPKSNSETVHNLQLVCRDGILQPYYNGTLLKESWANLAYSNPHPIKDPVGRGEVGFFVQGKPDETVEVFANQFRLVGTKIPPRT